MKVTTTNIDELEDSINEDIHNAMWDGEINDPEQLKVDMEYWINNNNDGVKTLKDLIDKLYETLWHDINENEGSVNYTTEEMMDELFDNIRSM